MRLSFAGGLALPSDNRCPSAGPAQGGGGVGRTDAGAGREVEPPAQRPRGGCLRVWDNGLHRRCDGSPATPTGIPSSNTALGDNGRGGGTRMGNLCGTAYWHI